MMAPVLVQELKFTEVATFPHFEDIGHGELFTLALTNNTVDLTHGLHRFPAKFIPQIPAWALREFGGDGTMVVDPFAGSGTTLVEAAVHGGRALGVDIDPLARMISLAKVGNLNHSHILRRLIEVRDAFTGRHAFSGRPQMVGIQDFSHWFTDMTAGHLEEMLEIILQLKCSEEERQFLLVCFSASLRWVSNADDQTQKTYVSGTRRKTPPAAFPTFWRFALRGCEGLKGLNDRRRSDSTQAVVAPRDFVGLPLADGSADLFITSPPYLDSVDYMYNFMLEYFWLGPMLGVPDRATFNHMRRQYLGAKVPSEVSEPTDRYAWLGDLEGLGSIRRRAVISYFQGMESHFQEASRCLRPGGRYVLVVGNSQTLKSVIPVHDALLRLASRHGLALEKAFAYRIRRHYMKFPRKGRGGIILIDWIAVLRKVSHETQVPEPLPLPWATLGPHDVAN